MLFVSNIVNASMKVRILFCIYFTLKVQFYYLICAFEVWICRPFFTFENKIVVFDK